MDIESIKKIVRQVAKSRYEEFEMTKGDVSLKFNFLPGRHEAAPAGANDARPQTAAPEKAPAEAPAKNAAEGAQAADADPSVRIIPAPIVGRFYSTMTADSVKMVKKGDRIKKNQKICMIEAMNIEQEIGSPFSGILEETLVDDGEPVMYGQPLFRIRVESEKA